MAGLDKVGPGRKPTGPLPTGNGASPANASSADKGHDPAGTEKPHDSVSPAVKGKSSAIRASEDLPRANDADALPAEVAAFKAKSTDGDTTLLESGLPIAGIAGLRKYAERLHAAGKPGVKIASAGGRKEISLSGEALGRLKGKVQRGDSSDVVKLADLGIVGIAITA